MNLLVASTQQAAEALQEKAFDYVNTKQGGHGDQWSPIYGDGMRFAILFDQSIVAAFSDTDLGTTVGENGNVTYQNVVGGEIKTTGTDGTVTGTWEVVS